MPLLGIDIPESASAYPMWPVTTTYYLLINLVINLVITVVVINLVIVVVVINLLINLVINLVIIVFTSSVSCG